LIKTTTEFARQGNADLLVLEVTEVSVSKGTFDYVYFGSNEGDLVTYSLESNYHTSLSDTSNCYVRL